MMILLRDWTLHNVECKKKETRISKRTINERNEKKSFLSFIYVAKKTSFETQHSHPNCILL